MAFFLFTCSDSSLPAVSSVRLTRSGLLDPEPAFGVLTSNDNIIQKSLTTNILVEQPEQIQSGKPTFYPGVNNFVVCLFMCIYM